MLGSAVTLAHAKDLGVADTLAAEGVVYAQPASVLLEKDRYQVEGEIARGGLGKILRAHDQKRV